MLSCLSFDRHGRPADCLQLQPLPPASCLGPEEVRVRMACSPINPADLNSIEGTYGKLPSLPAIAGHEGAGWVTEVGANVHELVRGDCVVSLTASGCWSQEVVAHRQQWFRLPSGIDLKQACMLRVNPVTAWLLLQRLQGAPAGSWIVLNAANSGVGQALLALASRGGFRTLAMVRDLSWAPSLTAQGASAVVADDADGLRTALQIMGGEVALLAANAVGGESALRLLSLLAAGGEMVTYGAMSRQSLKVPNGWLIFRDLRLSGLWVSQWYRQTNPSQIRETLQDLAGLIHSGALAVPIDRVFGMEDFPAALARASVGGRQGKVLLDLGLADLPTGIPH